MVVLDDLPYRRMITKSRVPKFMAWQFPIIEQHCKTVFYIDGSSRLRIDNLFLPFLRDLKAQVLSSEVGFATALHSKKERTVKLELEAILKSNKKTLK